MGKDTHNPIDDSRCFVPPFDEDELQELSSTHRGLLLGDADATRPGAAIALEELDDGYLVIRLHTLGPQAIVIDLAAAGRLGVALLRAKRTLEIRPVQPDGPD